MRSTLVRVFVAALLVLATSAPGSGAPAGLVWNGEAAAVTENQEAWNSWRAVTNYKSKVTANTNQGPMEIGWEWVKPNRLRLSFTRPEPGAFIIIGTDRWSTSPTRGCAKIPAMVRIPIIELDSPETQTDGSITVTRVGTQAIDGVNTNVFDTVTVSAGKTARKRVYIVPATKQFKRWEVDTDQGKAIIDYLEFNTGITINPPC